MPKRSPRITGPGAALNGRPEALDDKRRHAFRLVSEYQRREREAFQNAPGHLQEIARFQGLLERPVVTWEQAQRWPEGHCDALIRHYSPRPRFVW